MSHPKLAFETDVLIVGSGAAGLMCLTELDPALDVAIISKSDLHEGSTNYAQGGIACVVDQEDSFSSHDEDTHYAGDGLCDVEPVKILTREGPAVIESLQDWMSFDKKSDGSLQLGHEGAHSHRRILHAGGDATGACIQKGLIKRAYTRKKKRELENYSLVKLLMSEGKCSGALVRNWQTNELSLIKANTIVLASGGYSKIYRESTNPNTSTGDGMSLAYEAGAEIRDPEFVQFHPTALFIAGAPRFLISEAVRGEGAILRNARGDAFMKEMHSMAELAPRDVVSRAIVHEMIQTEESCVFLDLTHLNSSIINKRFPNISAFCKRFDLNISKQWIPVRPAAHYTMGGVSTNLSGQTNIKNLYACGEIASTGVHGANRLASNSLLEALVFGRRVGKHISGLSFSSKKPSFRAKKPRQEILELNYRDLIQTIQSEMWRKVGVFRHQDGLVRMQKRIKEWMSLEVPSRGVNSDCDAFRIALLNAHLVLEGALNREESRGAHHRDDFPRRDDDSYRKHTIIKKGKALSFQNLNKKRSKNPEVK